jgi:Zn-dependent protease with chaperone function
MSRAYRLFIVLLGLLIISVGFRLIDINIINPMAPLSKENIAKIYRDVVKVSGEAGRAPPLEIVENPNINAYASDKGIVIFTGLIDISDANTVALALGHELGHYLLGHTSDKIPHEISDIRRMELQADKYGAFLALRAGYDICDGRKMFLKFNELYGDDMAMDHPSHAFRYDQLNINCD